MGPSGANGVGLFSNFESLKNSYIPLKLPFHKKTPFFKITKK